MGRKRHALILRRSQYERQQGCHAIVTAGSQPRRISVREFGFLFGKAQRRQQKIIDDGAAGEVGPERDDPISSQVSSSIDSPHQAAAGNARAARDVNGNRDRAVDGDGFRCFVENRRTAALFDKPDQIGRHLLDLCAEKHTAVDVSEIRTGAVFDQLVRIPETPEPQRVSGIVRQVVRLIDQRCTEPALFAQQGFRAREHFAVGKLYSALLAVPLRSVEYFRIDNRFKRTGSPDPPVWGVVPHLASQPASLPIVDVHAHVVLVVEDIADRLMGPGVPPPVQNALLVQLVGDQRLRFLFEDKLAEDLADDCELALGAGLKGSRDRIAGAYARQAATGPLVVRLGRAAAYGGHILPRLLAGSPWR